MAKHCNECKQALTFAERWGIRKHVCDPMALQEIAHEAQEAHKRYLEVKRQQQETAQLQREWLRIKQNDIASRQLEALRARQAAGIEPAFTPVRSSVRSSSGSSRRVSSDDSSYDYAVMNAFSPSYSTYSSDSSSCDSSSSSSDSGSCSSGD